MFLQRIDAPDQRRLSRTGRPADHDPFAALHGQVNIAQHMETAVPLVHVLDFNGHLVGDGHGARVGICHSHVGNPQ